MTFSNRPNLTIVPYSRPIAAEPDHMVNQLLATIRLVRRGYSHAVIVREFFGDSPQEQATGHRILRRLRRLGFSVAAERAGETEFSRRLVALTRTMAGRPPHEIEKAIDDLLHADDPALRRLLAKQFLNTRPTP